MSARLRAKLDKLGASESDRAADAVIRPAGDPEAWTELMRAAQQEILDRIGMTREQYLVENAKLHPGHTPRV